MRDPLKVCDGLFNYCLLDASNSLGSCIFTQNKKTPLDGGEFDCASLRRHDPDQVGGSKMWFSSQPKNGSPCFYVVTDSIGSAWTNVKVGKHVES